MPGIREAKARALFSDFFVWGGGGMDPYNTRNHTLEVSARTLRGRHSRGLRSRNSDSPDEVSVFVCTTTLLLYNSAAH